jgi:hypothetical protein
MTTLNEYIKKIEEGKIPINTNGHVSYYFEPKEMWMSLRVSRILASGDWDPEMPLPHTQKGDCLRNCGICDKQPSITFHEDRVEIEDNHIDVGPFSVDIQVPSGKLLFNDTLPDVLSKGIGDYNVNALMGIKLCSEAYARRDIMHFFVGNSCPAIWRERGKKDTLFVGSLPEGLWEAAGPDHPSGIQIVGSICTDLWWASVVDQIVLSRIMIAVEGLEVTDTRKAVEHMEKKGGSAQVEPGTWRCTSYYHCQHDEDYEEDKKKIYCKLERVANREKEPRRTPGTPEEEGGWAWGERPQTQSLGSRE